MVVSYGWRGGDPRNMLIVPTEAVTKVAASPQVTLFVTANGNLYSGFYDGQNKGSLKKVSKYYILFYSLIFGLLKYTSNYFILI